MEIQVEAEHYNLEQYLNKGRWSSFWHQLDEVNKLAPSSVLEIGVGMGMFKQMCKGLNINVETVDIDAALNPDYIASVTDLPFSDNTYDVTVAFQVLEHLPYEQFPKALRELKRITKRNIIISLPDSRALWRYSFYIPKFGEKSIYIRKPSIRDSEHKFDGQHYWEISKKGYHLSRIIKDFEKIDLRLIKTYRVPENTYHRFFVLAV